jgi:hypothetical protein
MPSASRSVLPSEKTLLLNLASAIIRGDVHEGNLALEVLLLLLNVFVPR